MKNYPGPERRIHVLYVTRNTEYHVRAGVCVAVRDRKTRRWLDGHSAVGRRLEGSLRFHAHGMCPHSEGPKQGDAIYFRAGEHDLITSRLVDVQRPERDVVAHYPPTSREVQWS